MAILIGIVIVACFFGTLFFGVRKELKKEQQDDQN